MLSNFKPDFSTSCFLSLLSLFEPIGIAKLDILSFYFISSIIADPDDLVAMFPKHVQYDCRLLFTGVKNHSGLTTLEEKHTHLCNHNTQFNIKMVLANIYTICWPNFDAALGSAWFPGKRYYPRLLYYIVCEEEYRALHSTLSLFHFAPKSCTHFGVYD